jgi:glycerophosphoryl diester phosphodiesterase
MAPRPNFDRPIAHRGLHNRAIGVIENSRSAFDAAIQRGFAIECDVQLSSDGVPIVFHDDVLDRLTALKGPIGSKTAAELTSTPLLDSAAGDCPQRLTDFLAQIAGRAQLQIELKRQPNAAMTDTLARTAAEAIAGYKGPATVESFDPRLISKIRSYGYDGPLGIITELYDKPSKHVTDGQRTMLRHMLHWPWSRFSFISSSKKALDLPAVKFFRALGLPVTAWTIANPEERQAAAGGADQIVFEGFDPESA